MTTFYTDGDIEAVAQAMLSETYGDYNSHTEQTSPDYDAARTILNALAERGRLRALPDRDDSEKWCSRCGGPNVVWSAPSPLWNAVMREGSINGPWQYGEIICPICFVQIAEEKGIADLWRFHAERVNVPLETVTPSGRVWNEQTWLWDEPGA